MSAQLGCVTTGDFWCPEMAFVGLLKLLKYLSVDTLALLIRVLYSCLALHLRNAIAVVVLHSVCNIANASLLKSEPFITASSGLQSFAAFITSDHNVTELLSMYVQKKKQYALHFIKVFFILSIKVLSLVVSFLHIPFHFMVFLLCLFRDLFLR